jgi:hypothetical protein
MIFKIIFYILLLIINENAQKLFIHSNFEDFDNLLFKIGIN